MAASAIPVRVLLVTDDAETGQVWAHVLSRKGIEVIQVDSNQKAIDWWAEDGCDIILIDLHTPQLDGTALLRQLRPQATVPILLFISSTYEAHILEAYEAGADECISRPISPKLFLAKVNAWLRRSWVVPTGVLNDLHVAGLRLEPGRRQFVRPDGSTVRLSNLEYRVLHLLMHHPGQTLEASVIVDRVWGYSGGDNRDLLKNVIYRLRRKIEPDPSHPRYIHSMPGEGYMFHPPQ